MHVSVVNEVADGAYAAALGEMGWDEWATRTIAALGGSGGVAGVVDTAEHRIAQLVAVELVPRALDDYVSGYYLHDPQIEEVGALAGMGHYVDWPTSDLSSQDVADYVRWHKSVAQVEGHVTSVIPLGRSAYRFVLSVHRRFGADTSPLEYIDAIDALLAPLSRTLELAFRHGEQLTNVYWEGIAAARDHRATVLIDERGKLLRMNAAADALFKKAGGVGVRGNRLRCDTPRDDAALAAMVHRLISAEGLPSDACRLEHSDSLAPMIAVGHRLLREHRMLAPCEAAVLVTFVEPGVSQAPRPEMLRRAFGLTQREAEVASLLAAGHSLETTASRCRVEISTARTHLKGLFAKTGAISQATLVQQLVSAGLA